MSTIKQSIWILMTLIILACSGWYYTTLNTVPTLSDESLDATVDTTIINLKVRQFDANGSLANLLTTPLMEHIPKENIHLITRPHIIIQEPDQPAWDIQSKQAKSYEGGQRITFMQQVIIHQQAGTKTQESTLKTEEVTYYPKEKKATTELFVTFEQPGNTIQSTGMNAYLAEKRVELLHGARGSYEPSTKG